MRKIRSYDDPANFDITNRPSDRSLRAGVVVGFLLSAIPGAVLLPMPYTFIAEDPQMNVFLIFVGIGAAIGMSLYFPHNRRNGRIKRREYVRAGGDPTGITDHMFGAMGGYQRPDGKWQWTSPSSDI